MAGDDVLKVATTVLELTAMVNGYTVLAPDKWSRWKNAAVGLSVPVTVPYADNWCPKWTVSFTVIFNFCSYTR